MSCERHWETGKESTAKDEGEPGDRPDAQADMCLGVKVRPAAE